jgi:hypothetical protein
MVHGGMWKVAEAGTASLEFFRVKSGRRLLPCSPFFSLSVSPRPLPPFLVISHALADVDMEGSGKPTPPLLLLPPCTIALNGRHQGGSI